jgi:TonB family protein
MKILFSFLLGLPLFAAAQKKDTVFKYLDQNLNFTTEKKSTYIGVAIKREEAWFFYALYPDTTPLLKAYYKDKNLKIKEGPYCLYYPKNIKAKEGTYHNDKMLGVWKFWYPNGNLKDSGFVKDNVFSGQWKSWYKDGKIMSDYSFSNFETFDKTKYLNYTEDISTLTNGIVQGPFTTWYQNGNKEATGNFNNNLMDGEWKWYHENGNRATIETYEKGVVTNLKCFDTTGKEADDYCSISKPALLKNYGDYKQYIYQYLTWPEEAKKKGIEGEVTVQFRVTKTGQLENLKITSSYIVLNKAVEELFAGMKEWYPAISHNRAIDEEEEFVIPFRLNN